jgi:hypothetical protein
MRAEVTLPAPAARPAPHLAAAPGVSMPSPPAPPSPPPPGGLAELRFQDQRVADVAYRLATRNAGLCPDLAPLTGLVLHSGLEYSARLRPAAEAYFHIDDRPAVEAVAAGSPAQDAGLEPGDILLSIDGVAFETAAPRADDPRPPSYAPIAAALRLIDEGAARGGAQLLVQRGPARLALQLHGRTGCAYDAEVTPGDALNASADGRHVFITTALARRAASPDTLALVLGHEFAHDLLRHKARLDRVSRARETLGELGSTPASLRLAEREADYVGLYLAARAGYRIDDAPAFVRGLGGWADWLQWSHPGAADRANGVAAARDEIARKAAAGEPLTPTPAG